MCLTHLNLTYHFRATGPGWQGRINDILKAAKVCNENVGGSTEPPTPITIAVTTTLTMENS
ncbi:BrnA antitoxin family protein [Haematobacter missouriensis]|uniref:BrnA antitoxin family protein n=1 Tax=Haematobacter missouriensis TaxID=366616 RepID=UPI003C6D430B